MFSFFYLTRNVVTRGFLILLLASSGYLLFISQVRSAVIKSFGGVLFIMAILMWRKPLQLLTTFGLAAGLWFVMQSQLEVEMPDIAHEGAAQRFATLTDLEALAKARGGLNFVDRIGLLLSQAPLGIGLSRTGGAGVVFRHKDEFFDATWSFTDNLYLTLFTELGVPGFFLFMVLLFAPFGKALAGLYRIPDSMAATKLTAGACLALVFSSVMGHYGSDGSLALPESAYLWLFLGCATMLITPFQNREPDFSDELEDF